MMTLFDTIFLHYPVSVSNLLIHTMEQKGKNNLERHFSDALPQARFNYFTCIIANKANSDHVKNAHFLFRFISANIHRFYTKGVYIFHYFTEYSLWHK